MENNKNHILIVDDDDRIRGLLKDYLSENNYIVSTAENAEQAKERIALIKFDIIILDVMMPGQNGYELTKEIRKKLKEISSNFEVFTALRNEPLLLASPDNKRLIELLSKHVG